MGYTKLFSEIITSTIWAEPDEIRIVWITMLALKDKWGVVGATVPGLAHLARVETEVCRKAIDKFLGPDGDSRTPDNEGRRIEVVDGGWRILNHEKYRRLMSADERRDYLAQKQREHRERQQVVNTRKQSSTGVTKESTSVSVSASESVVLPFGSDVFKEAWSQFQAHRSEIRKPLRPTSTKLCLRELGQMGEARAVAALRHTIAKGWQGIREPDPKDAARNGHVAPEKPALKEPRGWKAWLNHNRPESVYSAGGNAECHEWAKLPREAQEVVIAGIH